MASPAQQAPAPEFASWPLNCLAFYSHLANDYARYVQALSGVTDPAQAARAEGDYGFSVMHDLTQAWYDLALSPFSAMAKVAASAGRAPGATDAPTATKGV